MLHAWNNYKFFAWSENELKPISKIGFSSEKYGNANHLGATLIGSMTTLYIMNMTDEFKITREWAERILNFHVVRKHLIYFVFFELFNFELSNRTPKYLRLNSIRNILEHFSLSIRSQKIK